MAAGERILFVDDEPAILAGYRRSFRDLDIDTAAGGAEGVAALATRGPFAVVVSDMRMPGMDGAAFLAHVRTTSPETVRMMLTGANDQQTAMAAVNEGEIFRFLTKPCPPDRLAKAIQDGLRQHRLVVAERELLENTLNGSVRMLTEILSLVEPEVFGRSERLRAPIRALCKAMAVSDAWSVELAAMLAHIGRLVIPPSVMLKAERGEPLDADEQDMVMRIPEVGSQLLANVPRLEEAGKVVLYQNKRYDGGGFPPDSCVGDRIPVGARILRFVTRLAALEAAGTPRRQAIEALAADAGEFDPAVIAAARRYHLSADAVGDLRPVQAEIPVAGLRPGQRLLRPVLARTGVCLIAEGGLVTAALVERLANFHRLVGIQEPLLVETVETAHP